MEECHPDLEANIPPGISSNNDIALSPYKLVVRNREDKPISVRYDESPFEKAHFKSDELVDVIYSESLRQIHVFLYKEEGNYDERSEKHQQEIDQAKKSSKTELYEKIMFQRSHDCPIAQGLISKTLKKLTLASCVLVFNNSKVLLTQRHSTMSFPNGWVAPGGRLDPGENFKEAAVREIQEEVGLQLDPQKVKPISFYESSSETLEDGLHKAKSHIFVVFYGYEFESPTQPEVKVQECEVQDHRWVDCNDLTELLKHEKSAEELKKNHGEFLYKNLSKLYPNDFERGLAEGHYLSFLKYMREKEVTLA